METKEKKEKFFSNVVLGISDGLIELSGALVGLSFALVDNQLVALSGLIMGVAASLSMMSSAYLQARHEDGGINSKRKSRKAAFHTGIAYFVVVLILIAPFLLIKDTFLALGVMGGAAVLIIAAISYYMSAIFKKPFKKEFGEMFLFTAGVAVVAFLIGSILGRFINGGV